MEKKNLDWANIGFAYMPTDMRYVSNYKDGAWDEGTLTVDSNVTINECAGILQYCQECFEGLKAYTTEDGSIVTFRPDMNAERMMTSAKRLEMPVFPKEKFLDALDQVVKANAAWVPPYGSGATLYIRICLLQVLLSVLSHPMNISSECLLHQLVHTSRAALSQLLSVSATLTVQHLTEQAM